jgi:hypothetical protein
MRFIETKLNKNKDKEVYVFAVGIEEAELIQRAVQNVYIAIPSNILPLHSTRARAKEIYLEMQKITNKS